MSTKLYFSQTTGNVEGDTALNAVNPRDQIDLVDSTSFTGALEVYVDPEVLNTKLGGFNDENDTFSSNSISITLNELIGYIAAADATAADAAAAINPAGSGYTNLASGSGLDEEVNALEFPLGAIDGDGGQGVRNLGHFSNLKDNLATEIQSWLSNRFDVKGEELFDEENFIATGSGSGWVGSGDAGDKRLLLALLREIAAQSSGSGSGTKGEDSLFSINSCTEQIRNAVDSFKESGTIYTNNGRAVTNQQGTSVTGYFEGSGTSDTNRPAVNFGFQNQDEIVWETTPQTSVYSSEGIRAPGNGTSVTNGDWKGIAIRFSVPIGREPVPGSVNDDIVGDNNPSTERSDGSLSFELYVPLVLVCSRPPPPPAPA